jgi:hypothetical protein
MNYVDFNTKFAFFVSLTSAPGALVRMTHKYNIKIKYASGNS